MHTIREITRLATMLAGLIAPQLRLGFVSASISCEHCRSSRNNPHYAPSHVIYYFITSGILILIVLACLKPEVYNIFASFSLENCDRRANILEMNVLVTIIRREGCCTQFFCNKCPKYCVSRLKRPRMRDFNNVEICI